MSAAPTADASVVAPGQVLAGKYRVERLLGEGGHGVVVAATHLTLNERVAIKLLRPDVAQDQETVTRFLREARASVRIKGEHVTRVLDVGSMPGTGLPYMVMEHLVGSDLSSIVEAKGWLPISLAVDYTLQTCEALAEAHGLGIVHRDIKPSNLFLTTKPDGSPCIKVLDFGISKAITVDGVGPDASLTQTQTVLGSPQYMAPEQMRSSRSVDGRTDIWAIGTTLHELLTGHPPFKAKTMPELFAMILQDPAPRLCDRRPDIPPQLEMVVGRCLEKDPARRFADVAELARALAPFASTAGIVSADRISRVGFNAARSSDRMLPLDAGSAPHEFSRTEKTGAPAGVRMRTAFLIASLGTFGIAIASVLIYLALHRRPKVDPSKVVTTTSASAAIAADSASSDSPPPPEPDPIPTPTLATPSGSTSAQAIAKKDPRGRPRPHPTAPNTATTAAPPPPPPTETARPPGVASSRYD